MTIPPTPMRRVAITYWGGARAAAGAESETVTAHSIADALDQVLSAHGSGTELGRILQVSSVLVDGVALRRDRWGEVLRSDVDVEVLPPVAGG